MIWLQLCVTPLIWQYYFNGIRPISRLGQLSLYRLLATSRCTLHCLSYIIWHGNDKLAMTFSFPLKRKVDNFSIGLGTKKTFNSTINCNTVTILTFHIRWPNSFICFTHSQSVLVRRPPGRLSKPLENAVHFVKKRSDIQRHDIREWRHRSIIMRELTVDACFCTTVFKANYKNAPKPFYHLPIWGASTSHWCISHTITRIAFT